MTNNDNFRIFTPAQIWQHTAYILAFSFILEKQRANKRDKFIEGAAGQCSQQWRDSNHRAREADWEGEIVSEQEERERGHIIILPLSFSSYSHELSVEQSKVTSELEQARKQLQHMKDSSVNDNSEMDTYIQVLLYTHTCLVFTISILIIYIFQCIYSCIYIYTINIYSLFLRRWVQRSLD